MLIRGQSDRWGMFRPLFTESMTSYVYISRVSKHQV